MGNKPAGWTLCGVCPSCAFSTHDADKVNNELWLCRRCGGYVDPLSVQPPTRHSRSNSSDGRSSSAYARRSAAYPEQKDLQEPAPPRQVHLRLRIVHMAPFVETLPDEDRRMNEDELLQKYVIPFFKDRVQVVTPGTRFQISAVDFKVISCFPPSGVTTPETVFRVCDRFHATYKVQRLHVLPTASSSGLAENKNVFEDCVKPFFNVPEPRHISLGETFVSHGIQFKVIACVPPNGIVTQETEIFTDGEPLLDIDKFHILPIFETLPNRDKNLTPDQRFKKYLEPFFLGRFQAIAQGEEMCIDGVDFKVIACDPPRGVVTFKSIIYAAGDALRAEDVKTQQMQDDEALALRLQRQEAMGGAPLPGPFPFGGPPFGRPGGVPMLVIPSGPGGRPRGVQSSEALQARLREVLQQMPENDRHRPLVQRLHDQLAALPASDRNFLNLLRVAQQISEDGAADGASQAEIENLPTHKFVPFEAAEEKSEEITRCMVCLSDFEKDEELRTLPCFHFYHKECIDKWLAGHCKCPICKTPISG